jgi:hypothetical protein
MRDVAREIARADVPDVYISSFISYLRPWEIRGAEVKVSVKRAFPGIGGPAITFNAGVGDPGRSVKAFISDDVFVPFERYPAFKKRPVGRG